VTSPANGAEATSKSHPSLEGSLVLERFRVVCQVDEKNLIRAYIARDERSDASDTPVLVKQFMRALDDLTPSSATSLLSELATLERLRPPGVMRLVGHGMNEDSLITAQLHPPGISLLRLCELFKGWQLPFPAPVALYVIRQLLSTLHQCHTHPEGPLTHGYLTPASVHLPRTGGPEIADFGIARLEGAAAEAEARLGFFQAQMSYVAPEVSRGGPVTPSGDTYSLALMLYRLLSGSNPLKARTIGETLQRVLRHTPEALQVPAWDHSERVSAILARALSKDPADRYPSCAALHEALAAIPTESDDELAERLSRIIISTDNDWGRIALLAHSTHEAEETRSAAGAPLVQHFDSGQPAFASGLLTEQPQSKSEHTRRNQRGSGAVRKSGSWLAIGTITVAVMMTAGLFLGRLSGRRPSGAAARGPAEYGASGADMVRALHARLRACADGVEHLGSDAKLDLTFDDAGKLSLVRLDPPELGHSRLGACMLGVAWKTEPGAPGTVSLVIRADEL
jgi:serine/threonine protein kinase